MRRSTWSTFAAASIGSVEVIRPLVAVGFDRNLFRIELDGRPFWVRPLYLGADADNFERRLRAASTGIAVAFCTTSAIRPISPGASSVARTRSRGRDGSSEGRRGRYSLDDEDRAEVDLPPVHPGDRDDRGDEQEPAGREDQIGADPVVRELGLLAGDRSHLDPVIDPPRRGLEIGSAQFRPAQRSSAGSGSIGRPRTWISKWRWQPTVRALPVSPTAPTRSTGPDPVAAADPRRAAQVGVEVAARPRPRRGSGGSCRRAPGRSRGR